MTYFAVLGDYFVWWYSGGLKRLFSWIRALFGFVANFFSVDKLFKTLFFPWKKLVGVRKPGLAGLRDWLLDSFISRLVGFFVRIGVLFICAISFVFLFVFGCLAFLFWIFWPVLVIISFLKVFF